MNRWILILTLVIFTILILFVGPTTATYVWSICDPNDSNCANNILPAAQAKGYWNFQYDDAAPFVTAGLYCCWWERWYKWNKFSEWKEATTLNLGKSVDTKSFTPDSVGSSQVKASPTLTQMQPEDGYCPSCCSICDDDTSADFQARSDAIMAKKPWLTEGKNTGTTSKPSTVTSGKTGSASVTTVPTVAQMTFSDAV